MIISFNSYSTIAINSGTEKQPTISLGYNHIAARAGDGDRVGKGEGEDVTGRWRW